MTSEHISRDHMESVVYRLVKQEIDALRSDMERWQTNYVTRAEFQTVVDALNREVDRVDRQNAEGRRENKSEFTAQIQSFKADVTKSTDRSLVIVGTVLGVITFIANILFKVLGS